MGPGPARPHFSASPGSPPALLGGAREPARTSRHPSSSAVWRALEARTRRHLPRRTAHLGLLCARIARTRCPHSRVRALGARSSAPRRRWAASKNVRQGSSGPPRRPTPASAPRGRRQDAKSAFSPFFSSAKCKIGLQSMRIRPHLPELNIGGYRNTRTALFHEARSRPEASFSMD